MSSKSGSFAVRAAPCIFHKARKPVLHEQMFFRKVPQYRNFNCPFIQQLLRRCIPTSPKYDFSIEQCHEFSGLFQEDFTETSM
ncbi:MAG: hypothetical protein OXD29_06635 [Roseovarius sp.]|nr:hypothetical protein [Roseovarius sp.]MCY4207612.1 hypothetical protein [Roseovarius sp.]